MGLGSGVLEHEQVDRRRSVLHPARRFASFHLVLAVSLRLVLAVSFASRVPRPLVSIRVYSRK